MTNATVKNVNAAVRAGVPLVVYNIHTLPGNDPEGILRVFLVVALLARAWSSGSC